MELNEFHVGDLGPCTVADGHPVSGGNIRVAHIPVYLACTAR